jgi:hypothetical protein
MKMAEGVYRGRREESPGKMMFRYKGFFECEKYAREVQAKLKKQGLKTKVVHYTSGFALYVMAKHDFWKKNFIVDRRTK